MEFPEGTHTLLKVKNKGVEKAYFSILGISPDGNIYPVVPNTAEGLVPEECYVNPGEELIVPNYFLTMRPPFGTEVFKIFATPEPVYLEPIFKTKGGYRGRGSDNPISLLIGEAFGTRGGEGQGIVETSGSSFNFIFKIIPK